MLIKRFVLQEKKIVHSFEQLKQRVTDDGLMDERPLYFARKIFEAVGLLSLAFVLQYARWYIASALTLALCWQQLGWLTHGMLSTVSDVIDELCLQSFVIINLLKTAVLTISSRFY